VVVANVSALAIADTEENWQASLNVDLMHTVRLVGRPCPTSSAARSASIIAISSVSGRESDFASGPTAPRRPPSSATSTGSRCSWPTGHPRQHRLPRQHLLRGWGLGEHRDREPRPVLDSDVSSTVRAAWALPRLAAPVVFLGSPLARPDQRHKPRGGGRRPDPRYPGEIPAPSRPGSVPIHRRDGISGTHMSVGYRPLCVDYMTSERAGRAAPNDRGMTIQIIVVEAEHRPS
jgi:hypothetical protein